MILPNSSLKVFKQQQVGKHMPFGKVFTFVVWVKFVGMPFVVAYTYSLGYGAAVLVYQLGGLFGLS